MVGDFRSARKRGVASIGSAALLPFVPSDSDPEVRAHFRFDRIVCSNLANNAAGETSPLVAARPSRRPRFEGLSELVRTESLERGDRAARRLSHCHAASALTRSPRLSDLPLRAGIWSADGRRQSPVVRLDNATTTAAALATVVMQAWSGACWCDERERRCLAAVLAGLRSGAERRDGFGCLACGWGARDGRFGLCAGSAWGVE